MKKYKHANDKKPTERVGFYIALSICMLAVGFAVWSAYSTMSGAPDPSDNTYFSSLSTEKAAVAQEMTGVTEPDTMAATEAETEIPTQAETVVESRLMISETRPDAKDTVKDEIKDPLQAVLRVSDNLVYPVKSHQVLKPYSEDIVYNSTLRDYRAHTGCDFAAETGENVYAMCGGTVNDIAETFRSITAVWTRTSPWKKRMRSAPAIRSARWGRSPAKARTSRMCILRFASAIN